MPEFRSENESNGMVRLSTIPFHETISFFCECLHSYLHEEVAQQRQLQDEEGGNGHGEALFQRFMVHHAHTRQRAGRAEGNESRMRGHLFLFGGHKR